MKNILLLTCLSLLCSSCGIVGSDKSDQPRDLKMWYNTPAFSDQKSSGKGWTDDKDWVQALPIGNGTLGAMVYGTVHTEHIQLNEESLWSGSVQDGDNPDAPNYLKEIRELLFKKKYKEANELISKTQVCKGLGTGRANAANLPYGCYQTLGDLWIDFDNKSDYTDYRRELDFRTGVTKTTYRQDGVQYKREAFISYPDQVLVCRLSADKAEKLSFTAKLNRPERYNTYLQDDHLVMSGSLPDGKGGDGMQYMGRLKAIATEGQVAYTDSTIRVDKASEVTLLFSASTDYVLKYPTYKGRDYQTLTRKNLALASAKTYETLYKAHVDDFSSLFNRVDLKLSDTTDTIPTNVLVSNAKNGSYNPHLYELLFHYGRYLLISSSRPGTLPSNLQGIWANKIQTAWNGDYHLNINIEMNYWLADVTNLSECSHPLFDLIKSIEKPATHTAGTQYGMKGWVVHPITNAWGFTSPGEGARWGMHISGAAWICQHVFEHYRFTGNKKFLEDMYPVVKGCVTFYLDWLTTNPETGKLVSGPASSPENSFIAPDGTVASFCMGPTHEQQVIWELFDGFEEASEVLDIQDDFTQKVTKAKNQLQRPQIGDDGRLLEWNAGVGERDPGHRHISHLWGLHPGTQIDPVFTPELAEAAKKSLDFRLEHMKGFVGWSSAWMINFYARLFKSKEALESLERYSKFSLYPNLFTIGPPFQIEANWGTTAGIAEMLLQSHIQTDDGYIIRILPALPSCWKDGSYSGLKARGGFEVSAEWKGGKLIKAQIKSLLGAPCSVSLGNKEFHLNLAKGETWSWKD